MEQPASGLDQTGPNCATRCSRSQTTSRTAAPKRRHRQGIDSRTSPAAGRPAEAWPSYGSEARRRATATGAPQSRRRTLRARPSDRGQPGDRPRWHPAAALPTGRARARARRAPRPELSSRFPPCASQSCHVF
eukprot:5437930-Prymnesium_polylepis.1